MYYIYIFYFILVFFFVLVFIIPYGDFRLSYLGKAQQLQEQCHPLLSVCAVFLCVQTLVWPPIPFSVCSISVCPNMGMATHSFQCVQYFCVSKHGYGHPFLSVCAVFLCVQTPLPIPISVCSISVCPNTATHSYQCVQYFCVSQHWYGHPFLSVCAVFLCVQTWVWPPIAISVCSICVCPNTGMATHSYQCVQYFCVSKHWYGHPFLSVCAVFWCVQTLVWLPLLRIFNDILIF